MPRLLGGALLAAVGFVTFVWFYRRHPGEWELLFAATVVLTLWISPHLLSADWLLLIAPGVALWQVRPDLRAVWVRIGVLLAAVSHISIVLTFAMKEAFGWGLQIAVPSLAIAVWWTGRALEQPATK